MAVDDRRLGTDSISVLAAPKSVRDGSHEMLTLYHSPFSTCSQKVRIALAEKQIPWTSRATTTSLWLVGNEYSIADIVLTPVAVRMEDLGLSDLWAGLPHAADWYQRVKTRSSFSKAFGPGSRLMPGSFRPTQVSELRTVES